MRYLSTLLLALVAFVPGAQAQTSFPDTLTWELVGPTTPLYPDSTANTQGLAFVNDTLVASVAWLGGNGPGNVGGQPLYFDEVSGEWRRFRVNTGTFGGRDGLLHAVTLTAEEAATEPGATPGSQALFLKSVFRAGPADTNWTLVFDDGPQSVPTRGPGGALYLGTNEFGNGDSSLVRSRDGGRSWAPITGYSGVYPQALAYAETVPTPPEDGLPEGAFVSGDAFGMAYSHRAAGPDSLVWHSVAGFPGATNDVVAVQAGPRDGGKAGRFVATVYDFGANLTRVYVSDDGGATWISTFATPVSGSFFFLTAAPDGAVYLYQRLASLQGNPLRSHLHGSGDGGQTWADLGPVGGPWPFGISQLAVGPDGRLYVGGRDSNVHWGEPGGGVFRTVQPVVVAAEAPAPGSNAAAFAVGAPYPNPATAGVTLPLLLPEAARVTVAVYDVLGRRVLSTDERLSAGEHQISLDASRLAPGAYVARVTTGSDAGTVRFAVTR